MNITNPKIAIFFLAFLPQFTDPAKGSLTIQMLTLGGLFILTSLVIFSAIVWFAASLGECLKNSSKLQVVIHRAAGLTILGLALKLVLSEP